MKTVDAKIKIDTKQQADAYEKCLFATDKELEIAYNQASVTGRGDLCDIYFHEFERRRAIKRAMADNPEYAEKAQADLKTISKM